MITDSGRLGLHANLPPPPPVPLLYVSDYGSNTVFVYTYTNPLAPVLTQTLTGFPQGLQAECVNAAGRVYIVAGDVSTGASRILGYPHGGSLPIISLNDAGFIPIGCAFNSNGDLAVGNLMAYPAGNGNVAIYHHGNGGPTYISSPNFKTVDYLGYDPLGNLWLDGTNTANQFQYGEIAVSNPGVIVPKTLAAPITIPGNVQWDGQHMTVGNRIMPSRIYRVNPSGSTFGVTVLGGTNLVAQTYIKGGRVIVPDYPNGRVRTYSYPAGSLQHNVNGFGGPAGAVISP